MFLEVKKKLLSLVNLGGNLFNKVNEITEEPFYTTQDEMPLKNFISLITNDDLSALVKHGAPSYSRLNEAKNAIQNAYLDRMAYQEFAFCRILTMDRPNYVKNYRQVKSDIDVIRHPNNGNYDLHASYSERLNSEIFTRCEFDPSLIESYYEQVAYCYNRVADFIYSAEIKNARYRIVKAKEYSKIYTWQYFNTVLTILFEHSLNAINSNMTVSQYCEAMERFNSYYGYVEQIQEPIKNTNHA